MTVEEVINKLMQHVRDGDVSADSKVAFYDNEAGFTGLFIRVDHSVIFEADYDD